MPTTPISGKLGKLTYGVGPTTLGITDWSYTPKGNPIDVSNTTDGRRRIGGLPDAEGSFNVHVDTAATMEADLAVNTLVVLNLYTDGTKRFSTINAIISDIPYKNSVEGTYDATVNWQLASGTAPAAPA